MEKKSFERLIYKSLDGKVTDEESKLLMYKLQESSEYRKIYKEIINLRRIVSDSKIDNFKPFFEERLFTRIDNMQSTEFNAGSLTNSLVISFRQIAVAAALLLAMLIALNQQSGNEFSLVKIFGDSQNKIEIAFDPVQNIFGGVQ